MKPSSEMEKMSFYQQSTQLMRNIVSHTRGDKIQEAILIQQINQSDDINEAHPTDGSTALHFAAKNGNPAIIEALLQRACPINAINLGQQTPLHLACSKGHLDAAMLLGRQPSIILNPKNNLGQTPLHLATLNGHANIILYLLAHPQFPKNSIDDEAENRLTALHIAITTHQIALVAILLTAGAKYDQTAIESTPYHEVPRYIEALSTIEQALNHEIGQLKIQAKALREKMRAALETLREQGEVEAPESNIDALIQYVSEKRAALSHIKNVKQQIAQIKPKKPIPAPAANPPVMQNASNSNNVNHDVRFSNLLMAVKNITQNEQIDQMTWLAGSTPLMRAIFLHARTDDFNPEIIPPSLKRLISTALYTMKTDEVNNRGSTALHFAAEEGYLAVVQMLLAKHANVKKQNNGNVTPLHLAARNNHPAVIQLLLRNDADINAVDSKNLTPLHYAAVAGAVESGKLLVQNRARLDIKSKDENFTAFDVATKNEHADFVAMLSPARVAPDLVDHYLINPAYQVNNNNHANMNGYHPAANVFKKRKTAKRF